MADLTSPINYANIAKPIAYSDYEQEAKKNSLAQALAAAQIMKAQQGGELPAPLKLANEYNARLASGDVDGANQILMFAKAADRGLVIDASGKFQSAPGYTPSISGIEGAKAGAKQQAKNASDLTYAAPTAEATAAGKATGEIEGGKVKRSYQAGNMLGLIQEAEFLLPKATSGRLDTLGKAGKTLIGMSDEKTQADNQLGVIAAGLVSNVPRMEGPQSDKDVTMYREAAGDIANTNKPYKDRLAALNTIKGLQQKYAGGGLSSPQGGEVVLKKSEINGNTPIVKTQAQFNALSPGTVYMEVGEDGRLTPHRKP